MMAFIRGLVLYGLFITFAAHALTVDEAKQQGLIGETFAGYLAPLNANNQASVKLVDEINREREKKYREIAQKNNLTTSDVARIAGQKLVSHADSGEYVQGINGQWLQKK